MKWINVNDQRPEEYLDVLVYAYGEISRAYYVNPHGATTYGNSFTNRWGHSPCVTHWMPLPPEPEDF